MPQMESFCYQGRSKGIQEIKEPNVSSTEMYSGTSHLLLPSFEFICIQTVSEAQSLALEQNHEFRPKIFHKVSVARGRAQALNSGFRTAFGCGQGMRQGLIVAVLVLNQLASQSSLTVVQDS